MTKYENGAGDLLIVVEDEYIIFDNGSDLRCEIFDENNLERYCESGYEKIKNNHERIVIGLCPCGNRIFDGNRIKVRDYFECPKCKRASTRNDLVN